MQGPEPEPDEVAAAEIGAALAGQPVVSLTRFPTGGQHFVYDLTLADGSLAALRLSRRSDRPLAEAAQAWNRRLRPLGVPLPAILAEDVAGTRQTFPALLLERLPGTDLGAVIGTLPRPALVAVAERLVAIQRIVERLPEGSGYGFVADPSRPFPHKSWPDAIVAHLARSRRRIAAADTVSAAPVDRIATAMEQIAAELAWIPPTPFLHDITTKNVIVDRGRLTGIVDVDELCYGDPLLLVGLIRTALLAHGRPVDYAELWLDRLATGRRQRVREAFYSALFAADFLGEIGHRFNRGTPAAVDRQYAERLCAMVDAALVRMQRLLAS